MNRLSLIFYILIFIIIIFLIFSTFKGPDSVKRNSYFNYKFRYYIISAVLSGVIIFSSLKTFNIISVIAFIILFFLFLTILLQITGSNRAGSLPISTNPPPPHLGLDGVSNENRNIY